jgi:hypothetical protein
MSRRFAINRLLQDELIYELTIRGIAGGLVAEMRRSLALAMQVENENDSIDPPEYPYTAAEDLSAVEAKLEQVEPSVEVFDETRVSGSYQKLQSQLVHVLGRLGRVTGFEAGNAGVEQKAKLDELLSRAHSLLESLNSKASRQERYRQSQPPQLEILSQPGPSFANLSINRRSTLTNVRQPSNSVNVTNSGRSNIKTIAPSKWGLLFSGDSKGLSLSSFLEKVEEYRVSRNVDKETLLASGIDLFTGRAYQFYLAYREEVNSWDEFVDLLREEYLSVDYNEKLFEEIKRRTQGPDESMGIYLAVMTGYFKRLTCPISEETQLKILLRNIAPYYQNHLGLVEISSVRELLTLGRKLEARKSAIENYSVPPRKSNCLEPDLAYVSSQVEPVSEVATPPLPTPSPKPRTNEIVCFRCRQPGHRAIGCSNVPSKKSCFKCKKEGYTVRTCPNCSPKSNSGNEPRRA